MKDRQFHIYLDDEEYGQVLQYLFDRGIDYQIIQECIADGVIFESNGRYHNAVFVGKDETGTLKYAAYRGLGSSTFKGDAYGSDKQYSFRLLAKEPCQSVHLFEAAIDLLSYATLLKAQGKDYKSENLLSLSGVYQPKKESKDSKIPIALSVFLEKNPLIKTIHLHLDNDKTGRLCTKTLKELLGNKYEVFDEPPKKGKEYLAELLADENNSLWSQVLYGITGTDDQIVTVALSQIGTMGGDPYWSWYGFNSRVEWCACFVSWCANECGYIDAGVIPKYAGCVNGVQWFKDRGQWLDNSAEPTPGMIIFFDWADESGQDGLSDHTGIVQKVENGRVYTVEGNSGDSVRQNSYPVGYYEILGYGAPAY